MNILVCVKRVPLTGGKIVLTDDERAISTRHLGFTVSPHEECGAEEAVRLIEQHGGSSAVLTLGPPEAEEQLRDMMALGIDRAVHLVTDGEEWDPQATAQAIVDSIQNQPDPPDLILFGNELVVEYLGSRYPVTVQTIDSTPVFDPDNARVRA